MITPYLNNITRIYTLTFHIALIHGGFATVYYYYVSSVSLAQQQP
jgi:hypothetical protein